MLYLSILILLSQPVFEEPRAVDRSIAFGIRTETNFIYVLEASDNVAAGWKENRLIAGAGTIIELTNEVAGHSQFFRARSLPKVFESKPGTIVNLGIALSNSAAFWAIQGELPTGIGFTNGA